MKLISQEEMFALAILHKVLGNLSITASEKVELVDKFVSKIRSVRK